MRCSPSPDPRGRTIVGMVGVHRPEIVTDRRGPRLVSRGGRGRRSGGRRRPG
jgi:hypothetical protein